MSKGVDLGPKIHLANVIIKRTNPRCRKGDTSPLEDDRGASDTETRDHEGRDYIARAWKRAARPCGAQSTHVEASSSMPTMIDSPRKESGRGVLHDMEPATQTLPPKKKKRPCGSHQRRLRW